MIGALNFKKFERGSMRGWFDLRYHGMTIKGCRLMQGNTGHWVALPQREGEQNGEKAYFDQMYLTPPEREHVRALVVADLQAQGHLEGKSAPPPPEQEFSMSPDSDEIPF